MKQTQEQIEKLKSLRESLDWAIDLAENQLPELKSALLEVKDKIDNIKLPEIDTTELAKQGENPEATNSKILEEVQNKLTPLEAVLTELNHGKQEMVDALATKNVQSSTDKTLSAIASDVRSIAKSPITIEGGEMYEKQLFGGIGDTSPLWNLYDVISSLISEPAYEKYSGIVLAEYSKVSDSIYIDGFGIGGACLTSDGAFYEINTTHIWNDSNDGKMNRWIAYFLPSESTNITFTEDTLPRTIYIGKKVAYIVSNYGNVLTNIVVFEGSELLGIKTEETPAWKNDVVLNNVKGVDRPLFDSNSNAKNVVIDNMAIDYPLFDGKCIVESIHLGQNVTFGQRNDASHGILTITNQTIKNGCTLPSYIYISEGLSWGTECLLAMSDYNISDVAKKLTIDGIKTLKSPIFTSKGGKSEVLYEVLELDSIEEFQSGICKRIGNYIHCDKLKKISAKKSKRILLGLLDSHGEVPRYLEDVVVGRLETDLYIREWGLKDMYVSYQLINANIREHIAANISDGGGTLTFTVGSYLYNALEPETIAAFEAKNWRIASA